MSAHESKPDQITDIASLNGEENFLPGTLLGGRYRVISMLGRGGMGTVYRVEQIFIGKDLALKTINASAMNENNIRRFQAEAKAAFAVNHPNIISVHDFGIFDEQTPFMAMELVHGRTLADLLKARPLRLDEAMPIFLQVCAGLAHAHEHGVVHRDIKPSNIMILDQIATDTEGSVKILDFGIAKIAAHEQGEIQSLTRTGEVFGSPLYMSPEQCGGGLVDSRSDIYSLGCVLFESLTGTTPYVGDNALTTMIMHQSSTIPSLREASLGENFSRDLEHVIQTMLAKTPADRYQRVQDVLSDLEAISRGEPVIARSSATNKKAPKAKTAADKITMRRSAFIGSLLLNAAICCSIAALIMHYLIIPKPAPTVVKVDQVRETDKRVYKPTNHIQEQIEKNDCDFVAGYGVGHFKLSDFADYTEAQRIDLDQEAVGDSELRNFRSSNLISLKLRDCRIATINSIKDLPYLQKLDMHNTQIDDRAIPILSSLQMLKELDIAHTNVTKEGIRKLVKSTSLRDLNIPEIAFTAQEVETLAKSMPQCHIEGYEGESYLNKVSRDLTKYKTPDFERLQKLNAIAKRANPNLSIISENLCLMAAIREKENKLEEALNLAQQAIDLGKRNGDVTLLIEPSLLLARIAIASKQPTQSDFQDYATRMNAAAQAAIETKMHNSREFMEILEITTTHPLGSTFYAYELANLDTALKYAKRFANLQKTFYATFLERAAWYSFLAKQTARGLYPARELTAWRAEHIGKESVEYARALILQGHVELEAKRKEECLSTAVKTLDRIGCPDRENMKEHYCDACRELMDLYDHRQNAAQATAYCRKALAMAETLSVDTYTRKEMFARMLITRLKNSGAAKEAKDVAQKYKLSDDSLN